MRFLDWNAKIKEKIVIKVISVPKLENLFTSLRKKPALNQSFLGFRFVISLVRKWKKKDQRKKDEDSDEEEEEDSSATEGGENEAEAESSSESESEKKNKKKNKKKKEEEEEEEEEEEDEKKKNKKKNKKAKDEEEDEEDDKKEKKEEEEEEEDEKKKKKKEGKGKEEEKEEEDDEDEEKKKKKSKKEESEASESEDEEEEEDTKKKAKKKNVPKPGYVKSKLRAGEYVIEYAGNKGRAASCKHSKCKDPIDKGTLRVGKVVPAMKGDGLSFNWYHWKCVFEYFKVAKADTKKINSTRDVKGLKSIKNSDVEKFKAAIEKWKKYKKKRINKKKGKTNAVV